jgi:hypothetical protein
MVPRFTQVVCERMYARYYDATLQLTWNLGIGASGEMYGPDEHDE